jgi:hypothetical protein
MLKFLISGVWGALMTGAGIFVGQSLTQSAPSTDTSRPKAAAIQQMTTEMTGAPIISDGKVLGYLVFRIRSEVDTSKLPNDKFEVSPILTNAAFQAAYELYQDGFQTIDPHDIEKLTHQIAVKANEKLGPDTVKDVELDQFNYVPMDKVRQNIFSPK